MMREAAADERENIECSVYIRPDLMMREAAADERENIECSVNLLCSRGPFIARKRVR
jgi:hypothetical protein